MNGPSKDAERIARLEKLAARLEFDALCIANNARAVEATGGTAVNHDEIASNLRQDAADLRSILAEREKLREALTDFVDSAALIGNTSSDLVPPSIAKQGAEAWVRCLRNARAALAPSETRTDETRDRREVGR